MAQRGKVTQEVLFLGTPNDIFPWLDLWAWGGPEILSPLCGEMVNEFQHSYCWAKSFTAWTLAFPTVYITVTLTFRVWIASVNLVSTFWYKYKRIFKIELQIFTSRIIFLECYWDTYLGLTDMIYTGSWQKGTLSWKW